MNIGSNEELGASLLGYTRSTMMEIYDLYKQHASIVGFGVRKGKHRPNPTTLNLKEKYYLCTAAGERNTGKKEDKEEEQTNDTITSILTEESSNKNKRKRRPRRVMITRTNCPAYIRAKINKDGFWEVIQHVVHHNHPLTRETQSHNYRSERQISSPKQNTIQAMQECGLRPIDSYNYMVSEAGGE